MSLATEIAALKVQADITSAAVADAFDRKTQEAFQADNALHLENLSKAELIQLITTEVNNHANNKNNPHGLTPTDLNVYTTAQLNAMVAEYIPRGILPVSQFGSQDSAVGLAFSLTAATRVLSFTAGIPVLMAGGSYAMPVGSFTLGNNATSYIYVKLVAGVPRYEVSATQLPETSTQMQIGAVTFANGAVTKNTIGKVTRLDIYRISTVPAGSAIPVSAGFPGDAAALIWK